MVASTPRPPRASSAFATGPRAAGAPCSAGVYSLDAGQPPAGLAHWAKIRTPLGLALVLAVGALLAFSPTPVVAGERLDLEEMQTRSRLYKAIAKYGNRATVGVICKVSEYDQYYGTGVIISPDGYVLTSTTVVPQGAKDIVLFFSDHTRRVAEIVASDPEVEASLLKVNATGLPDMNVSTELPKVGERAYTFGNARNMIRLGQGASFSTGVISGVYEVKSADNQSSYQGLAIETDAAVNPGQDGGPLLNAHGQLVGIISLSYSDLRWQGVAVPFARIKEALNPLRDGRVKLSTRKLVEPPSVDKAEHNPFALEARDLAPALVRLRITRKYPPEKIERMSWGQYRRTFTDWADLPTAKKRQISQQFFAAERILGANVQVRRPDAPVTGVLVTGDGVILTSAFNLHQSDAVFVHKEKGLHLPAFEGDVRALLQYKTDDFKVERNPIKKIEAILHDGRVLPAKVLGWHAPGQVGALKIDAKDLPHFDIAKKAAKPKLGEVVAILGAIDAEVPYTLNSGIVSAEEREGGRFFQVDAQLNYGNSGGPVIDRDGNFLGIAGPCLAPTPILGRILPFEPLPGDPKALSIHRFITAPNSGIGMISRAVVIAPDIQKLAKGKSVLGGKTAFFGIAPDRSKAFAKDVIIGVVGTGTPAAKAGLKPGDVILALDGKAVDSWKAVLDRLDDKKPGQTAAFKIRRKQGDAGEVKSEVLTITVKAGRVKRK